MDTPVNLLALLLAIEGVAKDWHYAARGPNFYGDHELADRVCGGLSDFRDAVQETFCLARGIDAAPSAAVFLAASSYLTATPTTADTAAASAFAKLSVAELECRRIANLPDCSQGERKLLDDIAADIRAKVGLVGRRIGFAAVAPDAAPAPSNP